MILDEVIFEFNVLHLTMLNKIVWNCNCAFKFTIDRYVKNLVAIIHELGLHLENLRAKTSGNNIFCFCSGQRYVVFLSRWPTHQSSTKKLPSTRFAFLVYSASSMVSIYESLQNEVVSWWVPKSQNFMPIKVSKNLFDYNQMIYFEICLVSNTQTRCANYIWPTYGQVK